MGIESIVGEVGKTLLESETVSDLSTEFFEKDAGILAELEGTKAPELTSKITEHLVKEGRPGSAEYINLFSKSTILDKELGMIEQGSFNPTLIEQAGLPVMVDMERTTPEMLSTGKAALTSEAKTDFIGTVNILRYKLDQHIGKTAQKASEHYATKLTSEEGTIKKLQNILGVESKPFEIPLSPNESEVQRLEELYGLEYLSKKEIPKTFKRELQHMMRQRPGLIGLETSSSASKFFGEILNETGGNTKNAVEVGKLRRLHEHMKGHGMKELQIFPDFGEEIERSVERDFDNLAS